VRTLIRAQRYNDRPTPAANQRLFLTCRFITSGRWYTLSMWVVGAAAVGVLVAAAALRALLKRGGTNPAEGLSVSQGWIVSQRGNSDSSQ
jgi:hypothetical protein